MSLEPEQEKVEGKNEEERGSRLGSRVLELAPELLQAPDTALPQAGPSTESRTALQASAADEASGEYPDHFHREHVVKHEQGLEPVLVTEEEKEMEWGCGASAEALLAALDAGCTIKRELVLGPRVQQAPDISFMNQGPNADPCTSSQASTAEGARFKCSGEGPSYSEISVEQLALSTFSRRLENPVDEHPSEQKLTATHQQNITGASTFSCNICGKQYPNKSNLNEHLKFHRTEEKPHRCEVCMRTFRREFGLKVHYRIHTREKLYSCDVCGKRFTKVRSVTIHKRIHTGERPYVCKFCNKRFNHKNSLNRHVRIHTAARPYVCDVCRRTFCRKSTLIVHFRRWHSGVPGNSS